MGKRCDVTGEPKATCECGCEPDGTPEPWRTIPFQSPGPDA